MSSDPPSGAAPTRTLQESQIARTWLEQFALWYQEVAAAGLHEHDAMVLATADRDGAPSARSVLLKAFDERGFVFFTNLSSRKATELAVNPRAALVFPWYQLSRQVLVSGPVAPIEPEASDAYFASRAYGSQISAYVSRQSSVIPDRATLEREQERIEQRFPTDGPVPRPQWWGGLRLDPEAVEFWQGRPSRLHDRLRYRLDEASPGAWLLERLSP